MIYRILFAIILLLGLYQLITHFYRDEEKELRSNVRTAVTDTFPDHQAKYAETLGLFRYGVEPGSAMDGNRQSGSVVLVHGLDDPGKVWQNLTPALLRRGFDVWQFEYPNDQPLAESAALLSQELQQLRGEDIKQISIVAHSMGGLISREFLTSRSIDYHGSQANNQVPQVTMLIMVGTPNHGSPMVKLRLFSEVRDHLTRLFKGQAGWFNFIFDGAGEAKIDLLPGSSFLTELNGRPYPEDIEQLIIAGVTSPWDREQVDRVLQSYSEKLPGISREDLDTVQSLLASMTDGLGDGLVSVESTKLPGIPHLTVQGTHLSMIRNVTANSERMPPAIPIIIERLQTPGAHQS